MSEQSANSQDSARHHWHTTPLPANAVSIGTTDIRAQIKRVCPECGERVQGQTETCPACGEHLARTPKPVRCMHCHTQSTSELVICPGCGRELREAPPRLVTYGVPAVIALLLVVVIASQWERISPIAWARSNLVRGVTLVEGLSASIEPEMVIVMTPIVQPVAKGEGAQPGVAFAVPMAAVSDTQAVAMAAGSVITPLPDPNVTPVGEQSILAAAVNEKSPIGVGGPRPTDTPVIETQSAVQEVAPTATPAPTDTPVPTDTPQATSTPMPSATPTVQPTVAPTQARAVGMAAALTSNEATRAPTPTWTVPAADANNERNAGNEATGSVAQVAALPASETSMPTPTSTPTVAMTPLPTPTVTPVVYQVQAGDTLVTIASTYGVDVEELMDANDISAQDVYVIQLGQMLIIPVPTPTALPPEAAANVVTTAGNLSGMRLGAPALVVPTNDAVVGCATGGKLIWQRVQFIKDSDKYVLHLGFVNGQESNGEESVVWVLAQNQPVTQTEWELDTSLCELASDEFNHQWRWWVEVIEESDGGPVSVSPPSEIRSFVWK